MEIEFDIAKNEDSIAKHGVALSLAGLMFEGRVISWPDTRRDYGEDRIIALGEIAGRVHVCVYVDRDGVRRIISLRKANRRESNAYRKG